jgi:hypothetical protein
MFLNLVMLAGLGGAAIPLVLHLLARARHQTLDWGAMMFLADLDPRQSRSSRLKQWTLLGMRMLLVAVLAMALARPVVSRRWGGAAAAQRTTAVIILDRSASLGYEEAGRSRFEKAREAALQVLAGLRRDDQVSLVLLGEQVEVRHAEPTGDLQAVAREVAELQVSGGAADLARGLAAARGILDDPACLDRELYVITDCQAANWAHADPGGAFAQWVANPRLPTRFYVIPVGGAQSDNLAVESVELAEGLAIRGQSNDALVRVRNHSSQPQAGVELRVSVLPPVDAGRLSGEFGQRLPPTTVTIGAGQTATVRVSGVVFQHAGSNLLTAELRSPGLEADNRAHLAVDVVEPIRTLIVSGDERADPVRRESYFLNLALAPFKTVGRKGDPAAVTIIGPESLPGPLNEHAVIVLANVPQVSAETARALEQRVYEGAGLIICPGGLTRVDNYNALLYRDGGGLLPARLSPAVGGDGSRATSILGMELGHPVFRFRRGGDPLPSAVIGRYFPATPRPADADVLAEYATGEPMLIEGARGRGRVLLLTTPLDADWNTLPLSPFYLPFIQSLVRHAHPAPPVKRNLAPGERIAAAFPQPLADLVLDEKPVRDQLSADGLQLRYDQTHRPGVYRLAYRTRAERARGDHGWNLSYYVVRREPRESDLTPMSEEQWASRQQALGFERLEPGGGEGVELSRLLAEQRAGRELWLTLLLAAFGLALGEIALARFWTEGAA